MRRSSTANISFNDEKVFPVERSKRRNETRIMPSVDLTKMPSNRNYRELWIQAKNKVVATIRMKKIITDIKMYGVSSTLFNESTITEDKLVSYLKKKCRILVDYTESSGFKVPKYIFDPNGAFLSTWNILMALVLLYTAIVDPFVLSFVQTTNWDALFTIDVVIDFGFIFDLLITFNTAYFNEENFLVCNRKKICYKYLTGWFLLDLPSSIPFGLLEAFVLPSGNTATRLVRISRLRNIPKLLRLSRLLKIAKNLKYLQDLDFILSMNQRLLRFFKVIAGIILCVHVTGCLWHLSAKMEDYSPDTWVVRYGYIDKNIWIKYQTSIYWTLTTLTTLGYGDIVPVTVVEKIIAMIWMLFAVYFLSFSIGSLTTMLADTDSREKLINEKLLLVDEFFMTTQLSVEIMHKLKRSIRLSTDIINFDLSDKDNLFEKLPISLKLELAKSMFGGAMTKFMFFTLRDEIFVANIAVYLEQSLVLPGQIIWNAGEPCSGVYFIVTGRIHYTFGSEDSIFMSLVEGNYFGDVEIVKKEVRKFNVICFLHSECLVLPRNIFLRIAEMFPGVWNEIVDLVKEREARIFSNLAEMKVLHAENKVKGMKSIDGKEIHKKIKKEYENLMDSANKGKNSQRKIEEIERQVQCNLETINNLEQKLSNLVLKLTSKTSSS